MNDQIEDNNDKDCYSVDEKTKKRPSEETEDSEEKNSDEE